MKSVLLLVAGAAAGFVAAHYISKTPQGEKFFADVDEKAKEFGAAVVDGYKAREAELKQMLQQAMGEASRAEFTNGHISWRKAKDSVGFDVVAAAGPDRAVGTALWCAALLALGVAGAVQGEARCEVDGVLGMLADEVERGVDTGGVDM